MDQVMATNGVGSDVGAKAGVGACEMLGRGYDRLSADLSSAASKGAVALGGAILVNAGGYVIRETYYYFRPTPEMVQEREARKAEHERKVAEDRREAETARSDMEAEKCRRQRGKSFSDCMSKNRRSRRITSQGYPEECRDQAFDLSQERDGESEVVRLAMGFMRHALDEKDQKEKGK